MDRNSGKDLRDRTQESSRSGGNSLTNKFSGPDGIETTSVLTVSSADRSFHRSISAVAPAACLTKTNGWLARPSASCSERCAAAVTSGGGKLVNSEPERQHIVSGWG